MFELLERGEVRPMVVSDELIDYSEFAVEVKEKLGYFHLVEEQIQKETKSKENKKVVLQNEELTRAIKELDIMPFTKRALKKYKEHVAHFAKPKVVRIGECVGGIGMFIAGVGLSIGIVGVIIDFLSITNVLLWSFFGVPWGLVLLIVGTGVLGGGREFNVEWRKCLLSLYSKPVPEFVLQTALDIKERCSDALFFIEELYVEEVVKRDPFLIVQVKGGPAYYIEVWNEPKFKKERSV